MADLSHELGALRFVVDSPLSSKVAMFNNQVSQHKQGQLLNPFSQTDGRASPKPTFSKDEYGKPLAGSLTEARGQKANMHVLREMLELCQIIDSEGYNVKDEPDMRVIPFGELFNIYNYISDKVVGILLRARKHKLVEFEGEMLFQRRDDDVPIFLLKPVSEIRRELNDKIESIRRAGSPAPQSTSVLLDKKAHGLDVPKGKSRASVSRTPSPQSSKASSPSPETKPPIPTANNAQKPKIQISGEPEQESKVAEQNENKELKSDIKSNEVEQTTEAESKTETQQPAQIPEQNQTEVPEPVQQPQQLDEQSTPAEQKIAEETSTEDEHKSDVNNNPAELPVVVIEASAVYVRSVGNNEPDTQTNTNDHQTETPVTTIA